ncbi:MAG: phenylalanine--tRNA ligase subunit beta [Ezakiella massiliensis]
MLLSLNWLKEYVNIDEPTIEIASKLSDSGTHVESIISLSSHVKGVVTAKITDMRKHENADKLTVCDVDFGDRKDVIVTAATNMKVGDVVGVATPGAVLADGTEIGPHDFRGIVSNGMFVSFQELGFTKDVIPKESLDGLLIMTGDTELGKDIFEVLALKDDSLELEITPNRADCLSVFSMAIEAQATFGIKREPIKILDHPDKIDEKLLDVKVDTDKVATYICGMVDGVQIKSSPLWIKTRLMESGVRPVNNIVDITNYVMLETGVPLHAFDFDKISKDGRADIEVTTAKAKEEVLLLDDSKREVEEGDILIKANGEVIALGGVMGAANSEIDESTKRVVFEGAHFDKAQIRKTSKRLGLSSEAASRFSKPLDKTMPRQAIKRALYLAQSLYDLSVAYEEYKIEEYEPKTIELRPERLNKLLGTDLSTDYMLEKLNALEIPSEEKNGKIISSVPSFRDDLSIEADLIEEVGRLYGYGNIEDQPIKSDLTVGYEFKMKTWTNKIRRFMQGYGYMETLTYSFVGKKLLEDCGMAVEDDMVKIINPLGEEFSIMRPSAIPHFMEIASKNSRRFNGELRCFEISPVFAKDGDDYKQSTNLTIMHSHYGDFYDLSETLRAILKFLKVEDYNISRLDNKTFHPGRSAKLELDGEVIGIFGEIHPDVLENFGLKKTYIADIYLDKIIDKLVEVNKYVAPGKFPVVRREFSFELENKVSFGEIKEQIISKGFDYLNDILYYDEYRDDKLGDKIRSLTIQAVIGSKDHTLSEEEIKNITDELISDVSEKFGGKLR